MNQWKKVTEELPPEIETVLVFYAEINEYDIAQRLLGEWVSVVSGYTLGGSRLFPVTHWRALDRPGDK